MNFSVTKNGKELNKSRYTWNEKNLVFSTNEHNLVLDFSGLNGITFRTGYNCTFDTGSGCTFDTGSDCTFKTGEQCVIIRRDIYEVIEIPENTKIKLNDYQIKGYEIIKEIKRETVKIGEFEYFKDEIETALKDIKHINV